jgi:hypothetical protein
MVEPYHTGRVQEPEADTADPTNPHTVVGERRELLHGGTATQHVPLLGSVDTPSNGARVDVDRRQRRNTSDLKPVFDELQQRLVEVLNFFSLLSVFERT